jgi:hypothetical protein
VKDGCQEGGSECQRHLQIITLGSFTCGCFFSLYYFVFKLVLIWDPLLGPWILFTKSCITGIRSKWRAEMNSVIPQPVSFCF